MAAATIDRVNSKHAELSACEGVGPRIEALNTVSWVETVGCNSDR